MNNKQILIPAILTLGMMLSPNAVASSDEGCIDEPTMDMMPCEYNGGGPGDSNTGGSSELCLYDGFNYVLEDFSTAPSYYIYWEFVWQDIVIASGYGPMPAEVYYNGKYYEMGAIKESATDIIKHQICEL